MIEKGECEVKSKDKQKLRNQDKKVRCLNPGDHFGEIALIYKARRSASVVSSTYTTLAKISGENFENILSKFPPLKELFL